MLSYEFEISVDAEGLHVTSPDMPDTSVLLETPATTKDILREMMHVVQVDLFIYGLSVKKHMLVLDDPQADLAAGGKFKCFVVPKPD